VAIVDNDGIFHAVELANGDERWQVQTEGG